ncbi:MAG: membrane protein insertion efficiency factor YidD [Pseudonocardia sp.]|nr:membrane protein insertion efficiency factor YidD [Pseudonocardia sp.]
MSESTGRRPSPLALPLILFVRCYQRWVSPGLAPCCRFYPSCSEYAVEALRLHGLLRGTALSVWRLVRCAPWHPGGVDPVPSLRSHGSDRANDRVDGRAAEERAPC